MNHSLRRASDYLAAGLAWSVGPLLGSIARKRYALPRFQRAAEARGFQLLSTHYYDPTYAVAELPPHTDAERSLPGLELNEAAQLRLLPQFTFGDELRAIPRVKAGPAIFGYENRMYGYGDAEMLYNMVRLHQPRVIIEIGSGQSTLMTKLAIEANKRDQAAYECRQICVEPYEMPWLEEIGVEVIRERVEDVSLDLFDQLGPGDMLLVDSSHVIRPYGDVLREFQEIIPTVRPGVLIGIHDIFTPRQYPRKWVREDRRLWNEQYLLESFLCFNDRFEVVAATNWLKHNHAEAIFAACPMLASRPEFEPASFWIRRKAAS